MLTIDNKNCICLITIDRPRVNALDISLLEELIENLAQASKHNDHAVIILGMPGRFCTGLDTKELSSADDKEKNKIMSLLSDLLNAVASYPIPIAAAISGHCLGAGAVLAALCDYRVMEAGDYKLGVPEVKIGLQLPVKVNKILARLVGSHLAQRLCVEGHLLTPEQAERYGFVDDLVAANKSTDTAHQWCKQILSLPQETMLVMRAKTRKDILSLYEID